MPVKPTLGAAVFAGRPTWTGLAASALLLLVSFAILPGWLGGWRGSVSSAWAVYSPPVRWAGGAGFLLLGSLLRWRDPDARLLCVMALAPQLPLFYDQLLVQGVARTPREAWILVATSWVGGLAWAIQGSSATGERPARILILATIYLPALILIGIRPPAPASKVAAGVPVDR
jgi:hypothetical protein